MRFTVIRSILSVTVSAVGVISLASCSPDTPAAPDKIAQASTAAESPRITPGPAQQSQQASGANGTVRAVDDSPVPPKDAQWTLLVYHYQGPSHVADANALKQTLIRKTGRRDWYVIHSADESTIYLGCYRAFIDDPKDPATKTAQADLQMVKDIELVDTDGQPVAAFRRAAFVSIASPDPSAPPQWNLFNKDRDKDPKDPTRAYWSLQIMAFRAVPERKEVAVRVVEALRKDGVEAYYFHGETISSVCVGAWPMSAAEQESNRMVAQDKTPVAYPPELADAINNLPKTDAQGNEIKRVDDQGHELVPVAPKLIITDSSLKECMKKFYYHSVNGIARVKEGTGVDGVPPVYRDPSFLVVIPRAPGNGPFDSDEVTPADLASGQDNRARGHVGFLPSSAPPASDNSASIGIDPPPPAAAPGAGHLRRLGEN